jgi:hypothetical protein
MQQSTASRSTRPASTSTTSADHARELAAALQLIAQADGDEKIRWIAERDPDWFVDHVLSVDYTDRDAIEPEHGRIDRRLLDQAIARIALRDRTFPALANAS